MPSFTYIARDAAGQRVTGTLESANEQSLLNDLAGRGLAPVRIAEAAAPRRRRRRVPMRTLATAYQQVSDLLRAGVPLLRALRLLARNKASPRLAAVMAEVADEVADGQRLADAMARHPETFPGVQVAMVRAGERGGFLDQVLARLAAFLNHQADLRAKVLGNLIYPIVLLVVGAGIVLGALVFFVPRFKDFYKNMPLPLPTRLLMGASDLLTSHGVAVLLVASVVAAGTIWIVRRPAARRRIAAWQLRVPQVGPLLRGLAVARFCRILGTMLANGIPMLQAMRISRDAAGHVLMQEAIDAATDAVRAGEPLAKPLADSGFFDEDVCEMIAVGESANNLDVVLVTVAETIERRVDRLLGIALRLMEPLLLLFLAGVVMFIFVALVVPMMRMSAAL
ncbi:MAG: type II secretion system F family protein [Phycisphaerales bacterium]